MKEYILLQDIKEKRIKAEATPYHVAWNDAIDEITEQKNVVRAVPIEAFNLTKEKLLEWLHESEEKLEQAKTDNDFTSRELKQSEINQLNFALGLIDELEKYGEIGCK